MSQQRRPITGHSRGTGRVARAHMHWLWEKGSQPDQAVDQRQDLTERPVVLEDVTATGYLIGEAERMGIPVDDVATPILDGHLRYFEAIGAVGPPAEDPDVDPLALGRAATAGELEPGPDPGTEQP
ncbi:MAG: hypothetical protein R2705_09685 [Ilumatobacteraceae bacterium]